MALQSFAISHEKFTISVFSKRSIPQVNIPVARTDFSLTVVSEGTVPGRGSVLTTVC